MASHSDDKEISRAELYELAWSVPSGPAGLLLGVSDVYFGRICGALEIPRPGRGYWRKKEVGVAGPPPALLPASPGVASGWKRRNSTEHAYVTRYNPQPQGPLTLADFQDRRRLHELVKSAAKALRRAEPGFDEDYLKPQKRGLADIACSKDGLEKCLRFTSDLYKRLESPENGHRVAIAPAIRGFVRAKINAAEDGARRKGVSPSWCPRRPTFVSVFGVPIGLAVMETVRLTQMRYVGGGRYVVDSGRAEDYVPPTWVVPRNVPTGLLKLVAYSPFHEVPWQRQWMETPGKLFSLSLDEIVMGLVAGAHELFLELEKAGMSPG
ncbi:hypothetical protein GFL58_13685 [Rhizobium leguminosarum bv. viciae]|uniref:hypothetical protein n=1 Tax=Rhizobium leguminosarum TaxID=384 RepID=UPI00143F569B|nr:hypothetical protein [Rhizobium leguminosarum]NKM62053.1 hypothetical protein [Rhizobium leguminosarum bv. viciae]